MTDFISRMGAIEALGEEPLVWCDRDEYGQGVNDQWRCDVKALKAVPTADVVEVVRCKDCRWFDLTDPCGTLTPNAHRCKRVTRLWMEDDAFCAYGERSDDD